MACTILVLGNLQVHGDCEVWVFYMIRYRQELDLDVEDGTLKTLNFEYALMCDT